LNDLTKQIPALGVALAVSLFCFSLVSANSGCEPPAGTIDYSQFLSEVKSNNVDSVHVKARSSRASGVRPAIPSSLQPRRPACALMAFAFPGCVKFRGAARNNEKNKDNRCFLPLLNNRRFPILILLALGILSAPDAGVLRRTGYVLRQEPARLLGKPGERHLCRCRGGRGWPTRMSKSSTFLKDPGKFQKLGGNDPKGVLRSVPQEPARRCCTGHRRESQGAVF